MSMPADPHSLIRTTTADCRVHTRHTPQPHENHRHHVWPKGMGGPDIEDNIVVVCPTGHYNIHDLLQQYILHGGEPPYAVLRKYAFKERHYAELGFKRLTRKTM